MKEMSGELSPFPYVEICPIGFTSGATWNKNHKSLLDNIKTVHISFKEFYMNFIADMSLKYVW